MKQLSLTLVLFIYLSVAHAQVAINTNGNEPAGSSMLDVSATNKGMLMPRMSAAQRKAITSPEVGLMVFDTDRQTIYFFDGQKWRPMVAGTESSAPIASRQPEGAKLFSGFGASVAIYEEYVAVGAPLDSAKGVNGGSAYIFAKNNSQWEQIAKLSAPNPQDGENFGSSVSIYGDVLVVGAPMKNVGGLDDRGAVYIFKRFSRTWNYVTMLTASNGGAYDLFGAAVTHSGSSIIVGAPERDHSGKVNPGSAYVFGLQNNIWTQKAILNATDPETSARFGFSLDIWQNTLVVGAPAAPTLIMNTTTNSGALYIFNNTDANGFSWMFIKKLWSGHMHNNMKFGYSVVIENDQIIGGAPDYSGQPTWDGYLGVGAIFRFHLVNGDWKYLTHVQDSDGQNKTGTSVALCNGISIMGMPGWQDERGKVIIISNPARSVYDEDPNLQYSFGGAMAAHNGQFVITSTKHAATGRVFFGILD